MRCDCDCYNCIFLVGDYFNHATAAIVKKKKKT